MDSHLLKDTLTVGDQGINNKPSDQWLGSTSWATDHPVVQNYNFYISLKKNKKAKKQQINK